jgi:hypothetical protein
MLSRVTALEPYGIVRGVGVRRHGVPVRRWAVIVVGVIVVDVGVDVLPDRRPGGQQHGHGDDRCEHAMHASESMDYGGPGQIR